MREIRRRRSRYSGVGRWLGFDVGVGLSIVALLAGGAVVPTDDLLLLLPWLGMDD